MPSVSSGIDGNHDTKPVITKPFNVDSSLLITELPEPPIDLTEDACLWWNYYCGMFIDCNILSRMFLTSLHNLCIAHMLRTVYMEAITLDGAVLEEWFVNKEKEPQIRRKSNPMVKELRGILIEMDRLLASLGMTAFTSKVNNIDSKGALKNAKAAGPPSVAFTPQKLA